MTVGPTDNLGRNQDIVRHMSTHGMLTLYMEKGESQVKFTRNPAAFDLLVDTVSAVMAMEFAEND